MSLTPKTASALQAESISYEMQEDEDSGAKLLKLEVQARKRGFDTVANNLLYLTGLSVTRAQSPTMPSGKFTRRQRPKATSIRQRGQWGDLPPARCGKSRRFRVLISPTSLRRINTYGERFDSLFSSAHQSLWNLFERQGDVRNMLSLFRHSSFIWRLHGNDESERNYIKRLIRAARQILTTDVLSADQNTAYFMLRARDHVTDEGKGAQAT
jgi:hypothetical protein